MDHVEKGATFYECQQHRFHAFYLHDPGVVCQCIAAWALWFLGHPDQALDRIRVAVTLAQQSGYPHSLGFALVFAAFLHQFRREGPKSRRTGVDVFFDLKRLSEQKHDESLRFEDLMLRASPSRLFLGAVAFSLLIGAEERSRPQMEQITWDLDNLETVHGIPIETLGAPKVINTPEGKAIEFDGRDDGLLIPQNPLKGWSEFTVEVLFRPDPGGLEEQRFFHIQESGSDNRVLLETRLPNERHWFLDTFIKSGKHELTLYAKEYLHPLGQWHHAALVRDRSKVTHYVNGKKELSQSMPFSPLGDGQVSVGVRMNKVYWFKGAIRLVRFYPRALRPEEFALP